MNQTEIIQKVSRYLLMNEKGMVKEQDLINLINDEEGITKALPNIIKQVELSGLSLIRTTFNKEKYYVITKPGKDDKISPSMYGALGLIIATYNELGELPLDDMVSLFKECWEDVEALIEENYLTKIQNKLEITPLGKASFKNIFKSLNLKKITNL